MKNTLTTEYGI